MGKRIRQTKEKEAPSLETNNAESQTKVITRKAEQANQVKSYSNVKVKRAEHETWKKQSIQMRKNWTKIYKLIRLCNQNLE